MSGLQFVTTKAGRAALVNAEHNGTAPIEVTEIGITAAVFTPNEDMTTLPGEIKRLSTISGEVVAPDTIHVTIRDDGADTYTVRGIGYWLNNGVLLGVYGQAEPILEKSAQSMILLAADTIFTTIKATSLTFGNANFTNPPATAERQGVVELATAEETKAGIDAKRAVTPAGLTPALAQAIAIHMAEADPHPQYLTPERGNALYFRRLPACTSSDTDCDILTDTGVRDVTVANDRGIIEATHLPMGGYGYGTLMTVNGGQFIRQVYAEGGATQRTWERTGYTGLTPAFKDRIWKLVWDAVSFDPASKQNALGFTPVQQGTGIGQSPNIVKLGWSAGGRLTATVDATDLGNFIFESHLTGAVNYFAMPWAPAGWLKANGAAISRTTYAALFAVIGTTYGAGDASTTFNLPDLRGEFLRGFDDGRGLDAQRWIGSVQADQFKSHNHRFINEYDTPTNQFIAYTDQNSEGVDVTNSAGERCHTYVRMENTGGNETRPRNIALLACIKY